MLGIVVLHGYLILIVVFGAWSRRPSRLAVNPLAARGNMLAGTKDGTHQAASGVAGGVASANNGHGAPGLSLINASVRHRPMWKKGK